MELLDLEGTEAVPAEEPQEPAAVGLVGAEEAATPGRLAPVQLVVGEFEAANQSEDWALEAVEDVKGYLAEKGPYLSSPVLLILL